MSPLFIRRLSARLIDWSNGSPQAPIGSLCDETPEPQPHAEMGRYALGRPHTIEQDPRPSWTGAEMYDPDYQASEAERERDDEARINASLRRRITELEAQVEALHRQLDERGAPRMAMRAEDTLVMPRRRSLAAPGRWEPRDGR